MYQRKIHTARGGQKKGGNHREPRENRRLCILKQPHGEAFLRARVYMLVRLANAKEGEERQWDED